MNIDIEKRKLLTTTFIEQMKAGAGGDQNFDEVLRLFERDLDFAFELGNKVFHEVKEKVASKDDAFEADMDARGHQIGQGESAGEFFLRR